jgi:glutamate/tyrosine decarboxylase-like PLP-dependent enzyme
LTESSFTALLRNAAERGIRYRNGLDGRAVSPAPAAVAALRGFARPLPDDPTPPEVVLERLDELGSPATVASAGGRFFGFVVGGSLPATVAASWLATAWDQNAGLAVLSPVAAALEEVALGWLVDLLGLPVGTGGGFVTCATMANFSALAAARQELLARAGWDVEARGLFGAPELTVVVGEEVHVSVLKALSMLGLGRDRVVRVPVDGQGRLRSSEVPRLDERTLLCLQAGNVNTGAFDDGAAVLAGARDARAWVHVDGAFGLWARACPAKAHLARGLELADSWAIDGHKWLNVPYDSGIVLCRRPETLRRAMSVTASYLVSGDAREPDHFTPELSRRARGVEVWAALLSLGRRGLGDLVERTCRHATRFADGLRAAGHDVLNDVVLNQVLVSFGDEERTRQVIASVQAEGTCWCAGTVWQGRTAMRISVSGAATTDDDVERSLAAILRAAG